MTALALPNRSQRYVVVRSNGDTSAGSLTPPACQTTPLEDLHCRTSSQQSIEAAPTSVSADQTGGNASKMRGRSPPRVNFLDMIAERVAEKLLESSVARDSNDDSAPATQYGGQRWASGGNAPCARAPYMPREQRVVPRQLPRQALRCSNCSYRGHTREQCHFPVGYRRQLWRRNNSCGMHKGNSEHRYMPHRSPHRSNSWNRS
jgi:hypothetical protein